MRQRRKKVNTWKQLAAIHERFNGDDAILGPEMLGFPRKTDAAREIMYISHQRQRVNLGGGGRVEKPKIFGNYEDMVGDHSSYIHRAAGDCVVDKIIQKFPMENSDELRAPLLLFLHYTNSDLYDVIEIRDVEDLTEKYGFENDNSKVLNMREGDNLKEGELINSPKCYDEFGNYGFGKNYTFMYQVSDNTIEDGIEVSCEIADDMSSPKYFGSNEVYCVKVTHNDNTILINSYGDADHYKCFPEIGEKIIRNQVCTQRIINNSQILFDLKSSNTRRRLSSDTPVFVSGEVVDIDIYCNKKKSEIPKTIFNEQILRYYDAIRLYQQKILDYTQELIDAGCNVSQEIHILNKDAKDYVDEDVVYEDENGRVFSNMIFYFTIKKTIGISKGQKITGRHGNKGVVSKKTPKKLMPHLETGQPVHIILDALGPVNRLNVMQLFEQTITFISNRNIEYWKDKNLKTKEEIFFKELRILCPDEEVAVHKKYKASCKTKEEKEEFFRIVEKYGIYINVPPYWSDVNLYDAVSECYDAFPWIKPYKVFFYEETSKRWVKMINDQIIGEMYFIKLKQSSKKGLSARSTGPVNRREVPDKTDGAKRFQVPYSNIPVRRGKQEVENDLMSIDPELTAVEQMGYRCSPLARKYMATKLSENYLGIDHLDLDESMTNINVQSLSCYLLMMGLELDFEYDELDFSDTPGIKNHMYKNRRYYCTTDQMKEIVARDIANSRFNDTKPGAIYFGPEMKLGNFLDELATKIRNDIVEYL